MATDPRPPWAFPDFTPDPMALSVGDFVEKVGGDYSLRGVVVAAFHTRAGRARYVVEAGVPPGLLHIYAEKNLRIIEE